MIASPTAPPTAPSGESVDTDSRNASPATNSSVMRMYARAMPSRTSAVPGGRSTRLPGNRSGCHPYRAVPATSDMAGKTTTTASE